jgi:hypothetical protein
MIMMIAIIMMITIIMLLMMMMHSAGGWLLLHSVRRISINIIIIPTWLSEIHCLIVLRHDNFR